MSDGVRHEIPVSVPQQQSTGDADGSPRVSYVLPVYNEVEGIRRFHDDVEAALKAS